MVFFRSFLYVLYPSFLCIPRHVLYQPGGDHLLRILCRRVRLLCVAYFSSDLNDHIETFGSGSVKWYSRLYRNQGSLLFGPGPFDWGEEIVLITGGTHTSQFLSCLKTDLRFRRFRYWGTVSKYTSGAKCVRCCTGREPNHH